MGNNIDSNIWCSYSVLDKTNYALSLTRAQLRL